MWNWPKSEHFKYELLLILEEMKGQEEANHDIDAIEDLQYSLSLSIIATEQHCQNWIEGIVFNERDFEYKSTIEVFVNKVNQILSEEQWSFE